MTYRIPALLACAGARRCRSATHVVMLDRQTGTADRSDPARPSRQPEELL